MPTIRLLAILLTTCGVSRAEYLTGIEWKEPPIVTPGASAGAPPSDAVVLFDGKSVDAWEGGKRWKIENGEWVVGGGFMRTKQHFRDVQLHIEWSAPTPPTGSSQGRGNSGVFFMAFPGVDSYEIQVLDSYQNKTYFDGQAGAIYKQTPPLANPMRPPGEWNVYEIFWTAPRFNADGTLKSPASITAMLNGVLVQNNFELLGNTPYLRPPAYEFHGDYGPIGLQDHGNPVRYRNIWAREFKPAVGKRTREPYLRVNGKETPIKK